MRKMLKIGTVLLLLCSLLLCGCQPNPGPGGTTAPSEKEYSVAVVDAAGKPYTSGVIVRVLKAGEQVFLQAVDAQGKVSKTLPADDYTVELKFTSEEANYYFDKESLKLSPDQTQLQVVLIPQAGGEAVAVTDSNGTSNAYNVETGQTYIKLEPGKRNYFLFAAKTAGTYRITTSDPNAAIGCYGYSAYIQTNSIMKVENNTITTSITASMVGAEGAQNPYVFGVDSKDLDGCILIIERIGDPAYSVEEDEPWVIYKATEDLNKYTLPEGTIQEFDLTADGYTLVFSEDDGFYHLNTADGPLVLVRLGTETNYLASFEEVTSRTGIKRYFYDKDGKFVKREDYTQCLKDYIEVCDDVEGLYPLTEDLKYIIQGHGEYVGWWDSKSPSFIFVDAEGNKLVGLNAEIAWLFACCYLEQ